LPFVRIPFDPSLDHDFADHSVLGVALAVGADDATPEIRRPTGGYGYEPPFGDVPWIYFDLADGALELGKRRPLAITVLHDLDLARVDELRESMRDEIAGCPACLLNIAKRSLPKLILRGVGLASNDAVG
jgi:hypothetical protein